MTTNATITYKGHPLDVLAQLIERRKAVLGEAFKDAVVATAITVVKSLRADTKTAPVKADPHMYHVYRLPGVAAWNGRKGHRRRTARLSSHGHVVGEYTPVNLMYGLKGEGEIYQIRLNNEHVTWERTKNKGRYVVLAPDAATAHRYAIARVERLLKKESGMGRDALGWAMAKLSTRSEPAKASGLRAQKLSHDAAVVQFHAAEGTASMRVQDNLDYARLALASGKNSVELALKRAANSIAGRLRKAAAGPLDADIPTPFPEVTKK